MREEEINALEKYARTLECLIIHWPPERQKDLLLALAESAGFVEESMLFDQNVKDRIEFHKRCIEQNYESCVALLEILTSRTRMNVSSN